MTVAPAIPIGLPWFKTPFGVDFNSWPRAARRLWEFFRSPRHQGADRFRFRDWELARALDVKRRVIQKGLQILERLGVIERSWQWGHDGGRVITITLQLAGPRPKAEPKPPPSAEPTPPTPAQVPNVGTIKGATPGQLEAARRQLDAQARRDAGEGDDAITPEEQAALDAFLAESRKRREAAARSAAAAEARARNPMPKLTKEQALAQIAAREAAAAATEPHPEGRPPDPGG
jgi:hypothetical protein